MFVSQLALKQQNFHKKHLLQKESFTAAERANSLPQQLPLSVHTFFFFQLVDKSEVPAYKPGRSIQKHFWIPLN